jgi:penicillin-binding protein 1A
MNGLAQTAQQLGINPSSVSELEAANIVARLKYPEPRKSNERRLGKISERTTYILRRANASVEARSCPQFKLSESNGSF